MKKTLYSVLALAMGAVAFTSCEDQLDIEQKGVTSIENFYKTDADAEAALAAAYEGFMCNVVGRQPDMGGPGIYTTRYCTNSLYLSSYAIIYNLKFKSMDYVQL